MLKKKHNNAQLVFVLGPDNTPLMPTLRGGRVRHLLKTGQARVVKRLPFTIQIIDEAVGREIQPMILGMDTGISNIGVSVIAPDTGTEYVSATFETNSRGIKAKMERRAAFRHTRTRFDRAKKKRRAKAGGTLMRGLQSFIVSGADTVTVAKDIRSSLCRLDKQVAAGKLSNTAQHALLNHQNIINRFMALLPIQEVVFELASFDIHKLVNPDVTGTGYQQGDLMGFANHREYVLVRDQYRCQLCNKAKKGEVLHVHHKQHRAKGGADHHTNLVTLHGSCHTKVHAQPKVEAALLAKLAKQGPAPVITAPATIMNTIIPRLSPWLADTYPAVAVSVTFGYITKERRFKAGIDKSHNNDAFMIASGEAVITRRCAPTVYQQFSRNSHAWLVGTKDRRYTYLTPDGQKLMCYNRRRATAQDEKKLSLADFRRKYGPKAVSTLKFVPGTRMWLKTSGYRFHKGDTVRHQGQLDIVQGNSNGGAYVRLMSDPKKNIKPNECQLIQKSSGFVQVT